MAKFGVIVPAAGKSERFGGTEKKPFAKLDGRPVFLRTLEAFINREDVAQTLLVVAPEDMEQVKRAYGANLAFMNVQMAPGGVRRFESVGNALKQVRDDVDYVAVHDAVRPCVTQEMIDAVFAEATRSGAAILAAPVVGTLKRVTATLIVDATVARDGLYEAQTPQVFRRDVLTAAYARLSGDSPVTDDAEAVERSGHAVSVVVADATNLKITTRADLALASAIIKSRPAKVVRKMGAFEEAHW